MASQRISGSQLLRTTQAPVATLSAHANPPPVDVVTAGRPSPEVMRDDCRRRVRVDGKFFALNGKRFVFRAVSYGTFSARRDGALFPESPVIAEDFASMTAAGFTVVRTYTTPPDDLLEAARRNGLHVLVGLYHDDWRVLVGSSRRRARSMVASAIESARLEAARLAGRDEVLAIVIGNEVPADAVRWFGAAHVADSLSRVAAAVHDVDPDRLVTYANYPTAEYLDIEGLDFLTFNVFLEHEDELRRYLTRLHHIARDRPLVLGEIGLHAPEGDLGETLQADKLDRQLETAMERGVAGTTIFSWTDEWCVGGRDVTDWRFGITRADRSSRPALAIAAKWNARSVADLDHPWPRITVAICAYNAAETLEQCLRHTAALTYPDLQILVVDDGSIDATAGIAFRHPRVELVSIPHGGLSVARNECIRAATGDLVAFLDADAFPTPEWPYYLALGMDGPKVAGVGGPNVPPPDDPPGAHRVAAAPGGPVHVLVTDDRAEHVPGCNMAFWRTVLEEVAGFDPVYTAAGDDVDLCWKVLDRGWEIGFHPAAMVWHRRRPTIKAYLKQQRGYGKAEALVAARHPDRYTSLGTARWRGRVYSSLNTASPRQRIYRGAFGGAAYQSVYGNGGHGLDLAHQIGVPVAFATVVLAASTALVWVPALFVAAAALLFVLGLGTYDAIVAKPPRRVAERGRWFRPTVGLLHLLQPLARWWGRWRHRVAARRDMPSRLEPIGELVRRRDGVMILPATGRRAETTDALVARLRRAGTVVTPVTGWEDHDGRIPGSVLVHGELLTSDHVEGSVLVRIRPRLRVVVLTVWVALAALAGLEGPTMATTIGALALADVIFGVYRTGPLVRRRLAARP